MNIKSVRALYMEQPDLFAHQALITKMGFSEINKKNYQWVQLDETIFHPKGGGQPSDEGTINGIKVSYLYKEIPDKAHLECFEIFHCFDQEEELDFKEGDKVELVIDKAKRKLYSALHTAG